MRIIRKITAVCTVAAVASWAASTASLSEYDAYALTSLVSLPDTGDVSVTIDADSVQAEISSYIYGINLTDDTDGVSAVVLKQSDDSVSTYNWETNYSNSGAGGLYSNDVSLVDEYSESDWDESALYTCALMEAAERLSIPVRLVTLPLMGYAAKDSMGPVSAGEMSRWAIVEPTKSSPYTLSPDITDGMVYTDEYVYYLVNTYGWVSQGGINGYFLDSEPDLWHEKYAVLGLQPVTPEELIDKSAQLAGAIKNIDSGAFVFGPSLSSIESCVYLTDTHTWSADNYDEDYSWFIDYYLSEMRKASEEYGGRLLDVLDIHYFTEAQTPTGELVLYNDDNISNAYRMQAVRLLWDSDYIEIGKNLVYKQYNPLLPILQASIRMYYPNTRLSVSEYDFGGGSNISGAIAEVDALGTFAKEEVFLACLSPVSEDYSYQKSAINLFTDYDGNGSSFGNLLLDTDYGSDIMSSVYSASSSESPETLSIIFTNKNYEADKTFEVNISSEKYQYSIDEIYTINSDSADIVLLEDFSADISDNSFSLTAEPLTIYLVTLTGEETLPEDIYDTTEESKDGEESVSAQTEGAEAQVEEDLTEPAQTQPPAEVTDEAVEEDMDNLDPVDQTVRDLTETEPVTEAEQAETEATALTTDISEAEETTSAVITGGEKHVSRVIKVIVGTVTAAVVLGVLYILLIDKK